MTHASVYAHMCLCVHACTCAHVCSSHAHVKARCTVSILYLCICVHVKCFFLHVTLLRWDLREPGAHHFVKTGSLATLVICLSVLSRANVLGRYN